MALASYIPIIASAAQAEGHELPLFSPELFHVGPLVFTSSSIFCLAIGLILIAFARYATRQIKPVPDGAQNLWELVIESLYNLLEGILGHDLLKKTFWFFATVFIFIMTSNWFGLIPGVGTIGYGHRTESGHFLVTEPLIRGVNADLNMTLAMALVFFALWIIWAIQANGPWGVVKHVFFPSTGVKGIGGLLLGIVFFLVGFIEIVSIMLRPPALALRLYGNIYGGEVMLEKMFALMPAFSWLIPIPFYFLELLVGVVQALVFTLLTAVFTALMCRHDHHAEESAHH